MYVRGAVCIAICVNLVLLLADPCRSVTVINKCCDKGMVFERGLKCVRNPNSLNESADFDWFPVNSIVDGRTMSIVTSRRTEYRNFLEREVVVAHGKRPVCDVNDADSTTFTTEKPFFHFIFYNVSHVRVHVSSNKTLHHFADAVRFPVVECDDCDDDLEDKGSMALRTFSLEDVCVDAVLNSNRHRLLICPCLSQTCIRKCCKDDEYYNVTMQSCERRDENVGEITSKWRPKDFAEGIVRQYYLLSDTFPSCENPLLLKVPDHAYKACNRFNKDSDNDFTIFNNGSLKVNKYKNLYEPHQYCGEVTWHGTGKVYEQNLILCSALKNEQTDSKPIKSIVYGCLLIVGGVCLLVTVSVSLYLPELRRRMHNKIALSHNASLMVAYFTWGIGQLAPDLGDRSCMLIALVIQFTFLASFFWLNVMCIDISMTFSSTRSLGHSTVGVYKKFLCYCIYSWGLTTIISVITMIMEFLPDVPYDFLKPGFACSCGFNTANASILIYFYGPMSVLLIFNLILFIFTSIKIMSVQRTTAILHKTDSNTTGGSSYQSDKQRYDLIQWLILYAKLFLLMGLTWITEIVSWAVGGPDYYWYFSDVLNLLRAVFIFILFICKRSVYENLKRKLLGRSTLSSREACSKSLSDMMSTSTSLRESKGRSSTNSKLRNDSIQKREREAQKLLSKQSSGGGQPAGGKDGGVEESRI